MLLIWLIASNDGGNCSVFEVRYHSRPTYICQ